MRLSVKKPEWQPRISIPGKELFKSFENAKISFAFAPIKKNDFFKFTPSWNTFIAIDVESKLFLLKLVL